jgi:hypothetical protein
MMQKQSLLCLLKRWIELTVLQKVFHNFFWQMLLISHVTSDGQGSSVGSYELVMSLLVPSPINTHTHQPGWGNPSYRWGVLWVN